MLKLSSNNLKLILANKNILNLLSKGLPNYSNLSLFKLKKNQSSTKDNKQDEPEIEVDVKIKEDIYDRRDVIDGDPTEKYRYNFNLNDKHFEYCTLEDLIATMKRMIKSKNENYNQWYKAIVKFNDFLCDHNISKAEIIDFLEILNFFRPKILEKKKIPDEIKNLGSQIAFSKKHEDEYFKLAGPRDVLTQFALFIKKNLKMNVINQLIKESPKFDNRETINEELEDVLGLYEILFRNIEMKVQSNTADKKK